MALISTIVGFLILYSKNILGITWKERHQREINSEALNNFSDRKHFIRHYQRNGWMDFSELRTIDSLHNEGTNTLVMGGLG